MPRNKYPEETVQKILDVSMKLFLEKGYEETTILLESWEDLPAVLSTTISNPRRKCWMR